MPRTCKQCGKLETLTYHGPQRIEFTDFAKWAPVHMDCITEYYEGLDESVDNLQKA